VSASSAHAVGSGRIRATRTRLPSWRSLVLWCVTLLCVGGLGIALYLTVAHASDRPIACTGIGDCNYVNSSEYAEVAGIRVAALGGVAYATLLALVVATALTRARLPLVVAWGLSLATFAFSVYLTYVELFVIDAICVWCVASALFFTVIFLALGGLVLTAQEET